MENKVQRNTKILSEELPLLKARVKTIAARLEQLNRRIIKIRQWGQVPLYLAFIDAEKCFDCGLCESVCPVGAITIKSTAHVNSSRCIGCGRCAEECPQGAIVLRPYHTACTLVSRRNVTTT